MKKLLLSMFSFSIFLTSQVVWSVDKQALEVNIRKSLNLTTKQKIVIDDPKPSDFAGLKLLQVSIDNGQYPIYLSPDEKQYFWGQVFDLSVDPDKMRASKISLNSVHAHGTAKAPVTVVEFTDLQCPYCKKAHKTIKDALYKDFRGDQVRLVFKHFPLTMHKWAEPASMATECVAQQKESKFWEAVDYYFDRQEEIKPENIEEKTQALVSTLKLDKSKFDKCMAAKETLPSITASRNEGMSIGVGGTPTYFVNGRMLRGTDYEDLKLVINEKLQEKR